MASAPSGWPTSQKLNRLVAQFSCVDPIGLNKNALSVNSNTFLKLIASDAVEANSTTYVVNATAHSAVVGDLIKFTSGTFNGREVRVVETSTNTITLAEDLASAPAALDTFDILRNASALVDASGNVAVAGTFTEQATAADGGALPALTKVISGYDGANVQVIKTDVNGELQIDVLSSALPTGAATEVTLGDVKTSVQLIDDAVATNAAAIPTKSIQVSGSDGTDARPLKTDVNGELQIDVLSSALPTGAATEATLGSLLTSSQLIDDAIATNDAAIVAKSNQISGSDGVNARVIKTDATGELQIDVVSSALPTGAATEATLGSVKTAVELIDDTVATTGAAITAKAMAMAGTDGANARVIKTDANGEPQVDVLTLPNVNLNYLDIVDFIDTTPVLDTSSTNITSSAGNPVEIVASLAAAVKKIKINDTTGEFIGLYTGVALSEVLQCVIGPGEDGVIEVTLAAGERVSLRNMAAAAISAGKICIQFLG